MKYGFKAFVSVSLPRPKTLPRSFNKSRDFKTNQTGLWCYLTPTGRVAKRVTPLKGKISFHAYNGNDTAFVLVSHPDTGSRFADINVNSIYLESEA